MSTKTLRKRVALIAVSAMGFGLLSATSASATDGDITYNSTYSSGVLSSSSIGGAAGTATMLTTGTLALNIENAANTSPTKAVVSAGGYFVIGAGSTQETISADQLSATGGASAGILLVKTTLPAGSTFTVKTYATTSSSATVNDLLTVTVAAASVSGTVVPANSTVVFTNTSGDAATVDAADASETTTGNTLKLNIQLNDAYKADISSTTGALVVTASTGANVAISTDANAVSGTGTFSTAVSSASPADINAVVSEATAGTGWSGTITVTYNGVVVATKSGKITGQVAKLEIAAAKIGKNNGSASAKSLTYKATDAAGNTLALDESLVVNSLSSNTAIISSSDGTVSSSTSEVGYGAVICVSGATGSADVTLQTTVAATGVTIKSNAVAVKCGGAADTYTAKFDKAKYNQGDIATLTISFKDAKGAVANSYDSVTSTNAAKDSISTPMMKQIGALTGAELADKDGNLVIKYNVGDVSSFAAGKYNSVVTLASSASTYGANYAAQTVAYEITGAGGVSNSDILASIVKLITAINKQIAALQKLLLKK